MLSYCAIALPLLTAGTGTRGLSTAEVSGDKGTTGLTGVYGEASCPPTTIVLSTVNNIR